MSELHDMVAETLAKKALSEKESAEHDKAIAVAEKKEFEMERDQTEAIIVQNLEKYESLSPFQE